MRSLRRPGLAAVGALAVGALVGCSAEGGLEPSDGLGDADGAEVGKDVGLADVAKDAPGEASSDGAADAPGVDPTRAFLHADLWSTFWNDRTRCGAERTFLEICKRRGEGDCSNEQKAWDVCDPTRIVYGQVGPEKSGEPLCQRSTLPAVGGCEAKKYDFDQLRFRWYGAEWEGNWGFATLKLFEDGKDFRGTGETLAFSSIPNAAQSAMAGIADHGLGHGCVLHGVTTGDDKYKKPFGAFAWIEVPTGRPMTIASVASTNFGDKPFAGCNRGAATQAPWITGARGAQLGCVHVLEKVVFSPGKHYFLQYGKLTEVSGPPKVVIDGFALAGLDVTAPSACKR